MRPFPRARRRAANERGSQLLEFAFVVPILLLLVVGVWDFGSKMAMRQKMTNAAREGARVAVANKMENSTTCTTSIPCTVVAAASDVKSYLIDAGLDASWITPASPSGPGAGGCSWTYQQSGTTGAWLEINGAYTISYTPSGGGTNVVVPATQVTLSWPVTWQLAAFLSGTDLAPSRITTSFTMADMADICGD